MRFATRETKVLAIVEEIGFAEQVPNSRKRSDAKSSLCFSMNLTLKSITLPSSSPSVIGKNDWSCKLNVSAKAELDNLHLKNGVADPYKIDKDYELVRMIDFENRCNKKGSFSVVDIYNYSRLDSEVFYVSCSF